MLDRAQAPPTPDTNANVCITAPGRRVSLRLKSWMPDITSGGRIVTLAGQDFPSQAGATSSGQIRVLCLGPGEWLIASDALEAAFIRDHLEPEMHEQGLVVVDLTQGLRVLQIRGQAMREVLSKGCGLDLHPHHFPAGRCARTRFAQISVVIECLDEPSRFELHVARSYAAYLQSWLLDAAVEFEEPGE
jgi:sarcosine oxidase subunit gamma